MARMLALVAVVVALALLVGCAGAAKTEIGPSESSVRALRNERRPIESTRVTYTSPQPAPPQPETYRLRIHTQGATTCASPSASPSSPPSPSEPSPNPR